MKTVKRGAEVKRVSDARAETDVNAGWQYCPKAEWKAVRDGTAVKSTKESPTIKAVKSTIKNFTKAARKKAARKGNS
jgi:hypothetical protein